MSERDEIGFTGAVGALIEVIKQLDQRLTRIEQRLDDEEQEPEREG